MVCQLFARLFAKTVLQMRFQKKEKKSVRTQELHLMDLNGAT